MAWARKLAGHWRDCWNRWGSCRCLINSIFKTPKTAEKPCHSCCRKIRLRSAASRIYQELQQRIPKIKLNGHPQNRLAHNLSLTIPGVEAKTLIHQLKDKLSFSAGSACSTIKVEPSHVLKAIGLSDDETFQTIRLGLGQKTQDIENIVDLLKIVSGHRKAVNFGHVRALSLE